jgi:hypothetical protein
MHEDRLKELFEAAGDDELFPPMVEMVLKQRARSLAYEVARELVSYLLDQNSRDVYAFIAAVGAHPGLLTEFPQLKEPERYAGMQGAALMIQGTIEMRRQSHRQLEQLLSAISEQRGAASTPEVAAAALLDSFEWTP